MKSGTGQFPCMNGSSSDTWNEGCVFHFYGSISRVRMSGKIWNTLVFLCIYDGSNRSCHELICISFL